MQLRREKCLCYFCDEKFSFNHKCPNRQLLLLQSETDDAKLELQPRKQGYTIGKLYWVLLNTDELFYLRMMLAMAKGPCSYEEIRMLLA